jgi:hypothetical protein
MSMPPVSADLAIKLALGSALIVGLAWLAIRLAKGVQTGALNPASANNLAYQGANSIGEALTGDKDFSLGGWLYDKTHSDPMAAPRRADPLPIEYTEIPNAGIGA